MSAKEIVQNFYKSDALIDSVIQKNFYIQTSLWME
jgi:hypothetical protein